MDVSALCANSTVSCNRAGHAMVVCTHCPVAWQVLQCMIYEHDLRLQCTVAWQMSQCIAMIVVYVYTMHCCMADNAMHCDDHGLHLQCIV